MRKTTFARHWTSCRSSAGHGPPLSWASDQNAVDTLIPLSATLFHRPANRPAWIFRGACFDAASFQPAMPCVYKRSSWFATAATLSSPPYQCHVQDQEVLFVSRNRSSCAVGPEPVAGRTPPLAVDGEMSGGCRGEKIAEMHGHTCDMNPRNGRPIYLERNLNRVADPCSLIGNIGYIHSIGGKTLQPSAHSGAPPPRSCPACPRP